VVWDAVFYHPHANVSPRVRVSLDPDSLAIRDQDQKLLSRWPYDCLSCPQPAVGGLPLVLECSESPQSRLTILDPAFGSILAQAAPQAFPAIHRPASRRLIVPWKLLGVVALTAAVLATAFAGWKLLRHPLGTLPPPDSSLTRPQACQGLRGQRVLDQLTNRLAIAARLSPAPFPLVVDEATPQIFTMPGRVIVLTSGLINALQDSDELAALLAHEMGHMLQHGTASADTPSPQAPSSVQVNCHSESDELEADAWARRILHAAGLRNTLPHLLSRLPYGDDKPASPAWQAISCTHPITQERLQALTSALPGTPPTADWSPATPLTPPPALQNEQWREVTRICTPQSS